MNTHRASTLLLAAIALPVLAAGQPPVAPDPNGVLRKPIPDKIVVLTFDDGPASGYTVVAPILKSFGFNGSFYVCDFDSFRTRKDWYLTWRQMKAMADEGFEIGNHSVGHSPGFDAMMAMEDELLANHVPKPTTIAWPLHQANVTPDLAAAGYVFARGGHNRPYRPSLDNPFEIPSMWCNDLDGFVKMVRQAAGGKIVAICYHGVPDMEHPPVSLAPEVFKVQMQYLKDNHYKVIALRDLAEYIDPVKAAKLPPTAKDFKETGPVVLAVEEQPCGVAKPVKPETRIESKAPAGKPKQKLPTPDGVVTPIDKNRPNVFTWRNAEAGNWSDASKWSNNLTTGSAPAIAGQADYVLNFNQRGSGAVKNDLKAGFLLNQLVLGDGCGGMILDGNAMTFAKASANSIPPVIRAGKCQRVDINVPVILKDDLHVDTFPDKDPNCFISFNEVISGSGALTLNSSGDSNVAGINFHDVHFGILQINNSNTYGGGTLINGGKINVRKSDGLGTGPVTLDNFGTLSTDGTLANPLTINSGTLFHCALSGPITLNGIANFISDCAISGTMSGTGGFTLLGTNGTYLSMVPGGTVTLQGTNTYTGPTTVFPGTLIVKKAAALYNANTAQWTPRNITVHKAATLRLSVGGPGEFTGAQISALLANLTTGVSNNGLMGGSVLSLDTANVREPVTVSANLADSKGPAGGAFVVRKCGPGAMQLAGKNTYTGQTILESGTLKVSSLNSFTKGMGQPNSSLGVPMDIEAGEIVIGDDGKDGECALIYTGTGETTDRVINLAGKNATVTLAQAGTGLLKFTSAVLISGYGANKSIALTGDTAGTGELAGMIENPHDRAGKATTAVTKSGKGTWTLSGTNSYSGPTTVTQGTLSLANAHSLGAKTEVSIAEGAMVALNFKGEMRVSKLYFDGKLQPAGSYGAASHPKYIKGQGVLKN
ncbi:MAG: autotransporter-associated beta strand repeat-containing protein [Verrucomicrobia bacterium]|nr:autotransporter-associated beta strand repeat-containing protein [Verrucomicrobiota bacterium]